MSWPMVRKGANRPYSGAGLPRRLNPPRRLGRLDRAAGGGPGDDSEEALLLDLHLGRVAELRKRRGSANLSEATSGRAADLTIEVAKKTPVDRGAVDLILSPRSRNSMSARSLWTPAPSPAAVLTAGTAGWPTSRSRRVARSATPRSRPRSPARSRKASTSSGPVRRAAW